MDAMRSPRIPQLRSAQPAGKAAKLYHTTVMVASARVLCRMTPARRVRSHANVKYRNHR
jgi:hypothetical protein